MASSPNLSSVSGDANPVIEATGQGSSVGFRANQSESPKNSAQRFNEGKNVSFAAVFHSANYDNFRSILHRALPAIIYKFLSI